MDIRTQTFMLDLADWADQTFGKDRPITAPLHHLKLEVCEAIEAIEEEQSDPMLDSRKVRRSKEELADCFTLVLNAASKLGMTYDQLLEEARKKLLINRKRVWNKPDANGVCEHVRTNEKNASKATPKPDGKDTRQIALDDCPSFLLKANDNCALVALGSYFIQAQATLPRTSVVPDQVSRLFLLFKDWADENPTLVGDPHSINMGGE